MNYIIYHQVKPDVDCPDGIAAAWVASKKFPSAKFIGRTYTDERPMPEFKSGDRLIIVDFSFPAVQMESWADQGIEVIMIDHHKTALENLSGLSDRIIQHFDMNECGATLTWKTLFPDEPMPAFLEFVRSRDLWLDCDLFSNPIPETLQVHEAIASMIVRIKDSARRVNCSETRWVLDQYDWLANMPRERVLSWARAAGLPKLKEKREKVEAIASRREWKDISTESGTASVPVVTLASDGSEDRYTSDICSYLNRTIKPLFCACICSDGSWSLRSDRNGSNFDVGSLAKSLGGGGHRNAAGFKPKK